MNKPIFNPTEHDGNAFALLAAWRKAAKDEGWTDEAILEVLSQATASDYAHLVATLVENSREKKVLGDLSLMELVDSALRESQGLGDWLNTLAFTPAQRMIYGAFLGSIQARLILALKEL